MVPYILCMSIYSHREFDKFGNHLLGRALYNTIHLMTMKLRNMPNNIHYSSHARHLNHEKKFLLSHYHIL